MKQYISEQISYNHQDAVVIIGNFDGVHIGHKALLRQAARYAVNNNCPLGIVTFNPHPRLYLSNSVANKNFLLTPNQLKVDIFHNHNCDFYVALPFDNKIANLRPNDFINCILINALKVRAVVVGEDFIFAKDRKGTISDLKNTQSFETITIPQQSGGPNTTVYSSTQIRYHISKGNIQLANFLMGQPFTVINNVFFNSRIGKDLIGFPTANILPMFNQIWPKFGVYAGRVILEDNRMFDAAINWGTSPTFENESAMFEAHLFNFKENLYKKSLRLALLEYIRPERKFLNVDELRKQIGTDCRLIQNILKSYPSNSHQGQPISRK